VRKQKQWVLAIWKQKQWVIEWELGHSSVGWGCGHSSDGWVLKQNQGQQGA
jgi:hypothetical protein